MAGGTRLYLSVVSTSDRERSLAPRYRDPARLVREPGGRGLHPSMPLGVGRGIWNPGFLEGKDPGPGGADLESRSFGPKGPPPDPFDITSCGRWPPCRPYMVSLYTLAEDAALRARAPRDHLGG